MCFDDTGEPCAVALCGRITSAIEAASKIASRESPVAKHVKRNLPAEKHSCQVHARQCRLHWFPEASLSVRPNFKLRSPQIIISERRRFFWTCRLHTTLLTLHRRPALSWHLWRRLCCFRRCFRRCFRSWLSRRCLQKNATGCSTAQCPERHIPDYRNPKSYDRHCTCGN